MRPDILTPLFRSVSSLKGVGPAVMQKLEKLGITQLRHLLWHVPTGYVDRSFMPALYSAPEGEIISAEVTIGEHQPPKNRRGKGVYRIVCENETGSLLLTFFHAKGDYLQKLLPVGEARIISGRTEKYNGVLTISHPEVILLPSQKAELQGLEPHYPLTHGTTHRQLQKLVKQAMSVCPELPEWGDAAYIAKQGWLPWQGALKAVHRPAQLEKVANAKERLAYDELLANQLALAIVRQRQKGKPGLALAADGTLRQKMLAALPFTLTEGQQDVCAAIATDTASGQRMLRLLQGDVGSGKTVVALWAMLAAVEAGAQAALMAPTEIVARQHLAWVREFAEPLGLTVAYLAGSEKGESRRTAEALVASGQAQIIIGTHALFQEAVQFHRLALVVVDEQHRFGVSQRLALAEKGRDPIAKTEPHVLMMTATPIPRSLTMTLYGDMDVSRLTDKPPGRKPVDTRVMPRTKLPDILAGLKRALASGARIYWVCPLVEESEELPLMSAEDRATHLREMFGEQAVAVVHGRIGAEARQQILRQFVAGEVQILVATTVIEVGVNVPEASIMVIEHAERFGLAQLHQLRGRVGRGNQASHCILLASDTVTEQGKERLKTMRASNDGFFIAEEDLRLRGAGEVLGTRQSGLPQFAFADIAEHQELLQAARDDVQLVLNRDPKLAKPRGQALRTLLYLFEYDRTIRFLEG